MLHLLVVLDQLWVELCDTAVRAELDELCWQRSKSGYVLSKLTKKSKTRANYAVFISCLARRARAQRESTRVRLKVSSLRLMRPK